MQGGNDASVAGQYVTDWMNAYLSVSDRPVTTTVCEGFTPVAVIPGFEPLIPLCEILSTYDQDFALLVEDMLNASSNAFGDPGFIDRKNNLKLLSLFITQLEWWWWVQCVEFYVS
jgi:hypothetical protein